MAVYVTGGCIKCDSYTQMSTDDHKKNDYKLICGYCGTKYYSKDVIRDKKISKLLSIKWWKFWKYKIK